MIATLDTDGKVFFSLTHANTDSQIMIMFLSTLCRKLDAEIPNWKDDSIFLFDGAKYHTKEEVLRVLRLIGVQTIFSGPYSYSKCKLYYLTGIHYSNCANRAAVWELQARFSLRHTAAMR